jgi:hypothetical protein
MDKFLFCVFAFVIIYTIIISLEDQGEPGYCDAECQYNEAYANDREQRYGR